MKIQLFCTLLLIFFSCENPSLSKLTDDKKVKKQEQVKKEIVNSFSENNPDKKFYLETLSSQFNNYQYFELTDTIIEDLTGDLQKETIIFTKKNEVAGIFIFDGASKKETIIGLGLEFDQMGNDLSWVDYWAIVYDKETTENVFEDDELIGSRKITLKTPGIVLHKSEVGGGIIIFEKGKYRWIHQTC